MAMHARAILRHVTHSEGSRRRATYDDVLKAPEHLVAEIIDGELHTSPRPASPHALAASSLGDELISPFQKRRGGPGGWWILIEPELHLQSDVLVPDLAGWRVERMPEYPNTPFFKLAPDWLCEVLSPSTAYLDRTKKLGVYARERVPCVWLIDPINKTLEVLRLDGSTWIVHANYGAHDRIRAIPFDAIEIDLGYLWNKTPAPPAAVTPEAPATTEP
jgi:Uma2 family endonuclease